MGNMLWGEVFTYCTASSTGCYKNLSCQNRGSHDILIIHQLNNSIDEICHQCDLWQFSSGVVNDTPNTDNGSESHKIPRDIKITTEIKITTAKTFTYAQARIFNVLRNHVLAAMTDLELWTFCCIVSVFVSLVSYGIILVKDQKLHPGSSSLEQINAKTLWSPIPR